MFANLSFASAKQPYLEAERPIGKSLSRGKGFRDRVAWTILVAAALAPHRTEKPLNVRHLQLAKLELADCINMENEL